MGMDVPSPGGSGGDGTNGFYADSFNYTHPTNGLWLEMNGITNQEVYITAHNVITGWFQLLFKPNLLDNDWTVDQDNDIIIYATDELPLYPVAGLNPGATNSQMFFWARQLDAEVDVQGSGDVLRPSPGVAGATNIFTITRYFWPMDDPSINSNLVVHFSLSGTASNGVDYVLRNYDTREILTNSIIVQAGLEHAYIELVPTTNLLCLSNLTVTLSLEGDTNYLVESHHPTASITIDFNDFCLIATMPNPCGMDYHPPTHSLIVSSKSGSTWSFKRIDTNGVVNNWSSVQISGPDEVKLATVKTTANGFINGAMYFDSSGSGTIGWLSPDGSVSNLNLFATSGYQFYGLYVDQSGSFGGNLIALQPNSAVWRINASGAAVTNYPGAAGGWVEGVITLNNDTNKYSPLLAGKIFTGSNTVDTNGNVATLALNLVAEDCDIIPTNQNLYCADNNEGWVVEVPKEIFNNHAGDVLVTENGVYAPAALFIVHWDATNGIVKTQIPIPNFITAFEHVTFAPIDIPAVSPPVLP
jgi:hypothetical protein